MSALTPYWSDETCSLFLGDALAVLREMPDASADCCVTSPPYFGLRDYGTPGQIGLEASPAEYVERLREVFAEVRRVLADDGTLWLNLGDKYSERGHGPSRGNGTGRGPQATHLPQTRGPLEKSLLGVPWLTAFALQSDGWTWRNVIPWHKPNAMPESVTDRLSNRWEPVLLFSKSARYEFNLDAIREPHTMEQRRRTVTHKYDPPSTQPEHRGLHEVREGLAADGHPLGRNPGDFWEIPPDPFDEIWRIPTTPYPEAHFATFPVQLPIRCIKTTRPGATILDPFSGAGTTGEACRRLGRRYTGIDLNPAYHDLAVKRYAQGVLSDFGEATA